MPKKKTGTEALFIRIPEELKRRWDDVCAERKVAATTAGEGLIRWIVAQEPEVQSMIFGQLPARDDLTEMVLKRLRAAQGHGAAGEATTRQTLRERSMKYPRIAASQVPDHMRKHKPPPGGDGGAKEGPKK